LEKLINKRYQESDPIDTINERFDLLSYVARGLKHLHQNDYAHFDLKSANVLIFTEGEMKIVAKLGDFGLTMALNNVSVKYIPEYSAPEMYDDDEDVTKGTPADIFSYGMLFYKVMTLQRPWSKEMKKCEISIKKAILSEKRPLFPRSWKQLEAHCSLLFLLEA
jgi:serine/threonine protein kinase